MVCVGQSPHESGMCKERKTKRGVRLIVLRLKMDPKTTHSRMKRPTDQKKVTEAIRGTCILM